MELATTVFLAFIGIMIALAICSIGILLTGKSKFKLGMCGKTPKDPKKEGCNPSSYCSLCGKGEEETKE